MSWFEINKFSPHLPVRTSHSHITWQRNVPLRSKLLQFQAKIEGQIVKCVFHPQYKLSVLFPIFLKITIHPFEAKVKLSYFDLKFHSTDLPKSIFFCKYQIHLDLEHTLLKEYKSSYIIYNIALGQYLLKKEG